MTFTRRWMALFLLGVAPLAAIGFLPSAGILTVYWDGVLLIATLVDYLLLPPPGRLEIERVFDPKLSMDTANPIRLILRNRDSHQWKIEIHDEPPESVPADFADTSLILSPSRAQMLEYHVTPAARGDVRFGDLWYRVTGRLGLLRKQVRQPAVAHAKVYPNLLETARFTLMARKGRLREIGIRSARLAGAGREFESLREYQPDDDYRRIDWKASARRGKLISRQYEVERSQSVVLVLDAGRTMLAEIDGIAKIDYAVNAALLLAYVATLSDDRVGLLVFADTVQTWIPPAKGRSQVYRILEALYDVRATLAEPDYQGAFGYLGSHWRRRSLVVSFTDLWDPDSSRQTMAQLAGLQPRHLVACVTLMDSKVLRRAQSGMGAPVQAYEKAVAMQVLDDRDRATAELKRRGVLVVDSPAEQLSVAVVNKYLEVKERMML